MTTSMAGRPRLPAPVVSALKCVAVYFAFGLVYSAALTLFCFYRSWAGDPSDLPCVSWFWNSIEIQGWPFMALGDALHPSWSNAPRALLSLLAYVELAGFIPMLVWVLLPRSVGGTVIHAAESPDIPAPGGQA